MTRHQKMITKITQTAVSAFGEDHATTWLHRRSRFFGGRAPIEMANNEGDCQQVLDFVGYLTAADQAAARN